MASFSSPARVLLAVSLLFVDLPRGFALAALNGATRQPFVGKVAVAGATGRTGRYVVQELLDRNIPVVALVRNESKAKEIFESENNALLDIISCDLSQREQVEAALKGCNAAIWAASGITGPAPKKPEGWLQKIQKALGVSTTDASTTTTTASPSIIDFTALPNICQCLLAQSSTTSAASSPQLVVLSSAGVTRLGWNDELKAQLVGCADIPIVRLNPGNILNVKAETEELVRKSGVKYSIVRPCGLNDNWPAGSRPLLSQGDVAVGRIHRKDVASVLVNALLSTDATGKTFEVLALAGYPPATNLDATFARLRNDQEGPVSVDLIKTNFNTLQQLLPGEKQDAAALAMGQTYEQLDRGQEGRLGKRGQERIDRAVQTVA